MRTTRPGARARAVAAVAGLSVLGVVLAGCSEDTGGADVDETDMTEVAQQTRGYVDELAAMLGPDVEVLQDTVTDCVPGDRDSGQEVLYNLRVQTGPGPAEQLLAKARQEWESQGWSAETGDTVDLTLTKTPFRLGVTLSSDGSRAAVGGSSGCVGG